MQAVLKLGAGGAVTSGVEKTCMIDSSTAPELTPWNDTDHSAKNLHLPTPTPSLCCHDSLLFTHELQRHGEEMHRLCLQRIRFPVDSTTADDLRSTGSPDLRVEGPRRQPQAEAVPAARHHVRGRA